MTIKQRLFISNILIIIIPIIISVLIILANMFIFMNFVDNDSKNNNSYVGMIGILILVVIVFFTCWLFMRFVFRSITKPIDLLKDGVHEISDGNLNYRISYDGKDEFASICADFNRMAERLLLSVIERQKDETNRKELIAGISHDLRTPLTSIKAYLEGIEKGVASTLDTQKKYFDTIKTKVVELEHIINQLFLFSKIDIGEFPFKLEKVNIVEVLKNLIFQVTDEYKTKHLNIAMPHINAKAFANIDVVQFHNVVINILENSVKHKEKEISEMRINYKIDSDNFTMEFIDDGTGVNEESLDKLFDVFYRCDKSRNSNNSGSGLGLAISSKIIQQLGGKIKAENVLSGGLSIIITLPIIREG